MKTTELIYQYILRFKQRHDGNSPSIRQIMIGVGLGSTNSARWQLSKLEQEGKIICCYKRPLSQH